MRPAVIALLGLAACETRSGRGEDEWFGPMFLDAPGQVVRWEIAIEVAPEALRKDQVGDLWLHADLYGWRSATCPDCVPTVAAVLLDEDGAVIQSKEHVFEDWYYHDPQLHDQQLFDGCDPELGCTRRRYLEITDVTSALQIDYLDVVALAYDVRTPEDEESITLTLTQEQPTDR